MHAPTPLTAASGIDFAAFTETLLQERGISDNVPAEIREEMKLDILTRFSDYLNATVVRALPSDTLQEFSTLLDTKPSEGAIREYLDAHIPGLQDVIAQAVIDFRLTYLG